MNLDRVKKISIALAILIFAGMGVVLLYAKHVRDTVNPLREQFMSDIRNADASGALENGIEFSYEIPAFVCLEFLGTVMPLSHRVVVGDMEIRGGRTQNGRRWHEVCEDVEGKTVKFQATVNWLKRQPEEAAKLMGRPRTWKGLILFDALDRISAEEQRTDDIVRGLLRATLWLKGFPDLCAKVFLREDPAIRGLLNFPDASKLFATKEELSQKPPRSRCLAGSGMSNAD